MRISHALMPGFIFYMDLEVSPCMALSPASFSYSSFSTSFFLGSLAYHVGFQNFCKLLLLDLSAQWCLTICMQCQMLHEPLSWSWGVKSLQFSLLISHHLLLCPFLYSKLNHPELSVTIGGMFLMNQSYFSCVDTAPHCRHSYTYIYTRIYTHIHTHTYTYMHTYLYREKAKE